MADMIHIGLPHIKDDFNGWVWAEEQDGEVLLKMMGEGASRLMIPKAQAIELRNQLDTAIAELK